MLNNSDRWCIERDIVLGALVLTLLTCLCLSVIVILTLASFYLPPSSSEKFLLCGTNIIMTSALLIFFSHKLPLMVSTTPIIGEVSEKISCSIAQNRNGAKFMIPVLLMAGSRERISSLIRALNPDPSAVNFLALWLKPIIFSHDPGGKRYAIEILIRYHQWV